MIRGRLPRAGRVGSTRSPRARAVRRAGLRERAQRLMSRRRTIAAAVLTLALGSASLAYSAFSALTSTAAGDLGTGSVRIEDNDGAVAMFTMPEVRPGATATSCIRVTYGGTLPAEVRLYAAASGALAPHVELRVTRGTGSAGFGDCTGFQPDGADHAGDGPGVIYDGTLADYPGSWEDGVVDPAGDGGPERWTASESRDYRFDVTIQDAPGAWGSSASAAFRWQARNA